MAGPQIPKDFRTVIVAASVGNVIEWYDFYIFGSLATVLAVKFFEKTHPVAALLSTIALFTAGFLIRPGKSSRASWSQLARVDCLNPFPSAPTTSASGGCSGASFNSMSPALSRPTSK